MKLNAAFLSCRAASEFEMEALPASHLTRELGKILCCECGTAIDPNSANLCVGCLRTQVDITEGIPKQVTLNQF